MCCWVICWLVLVVVSVPHQRSVWVQHWLVPQPVLWHRNTRYRCLCSSLLAGGWRRAVGTAGGGRPAPGWCPHAGSMGLGGFCAAWWMLSPWKRWIFVTSRMRTLSGILLGLIKNLCYFHCVRGLKPARKFVLKVLTPRKPPQTNSHVIKVAQYEGRVRGLSRRPHGDNSVAAWSATLCLGPSTGAVPRLLPLCDLCK